MQSRTVHTLINLIFFALFLRVSQAYVYYDDCSVEADYPKQVVGDFFNLCVVDEEFEDETFSWIFRKTEVRDTKFINCNFLNEKGRSNSFTEALWSDVSFDGCTFGSTKDADSNQIVFDNTKMTNVQFKDCVFNHTSEVVFSEFAMNNVTFVSCLFLGNTIFEKGQINRGSVTGSFISRDIDAKERFKNDSFTFLQVTVRDFGVANSTFVNPIRLHAVDASDVIFSSSTINEFHCHSEPDKDQRVQLLTRFNDTTFKGVVFSDKVTCDRTSWRGFTMQNVTFSTDATFARSEIQDIYWSGVKSNNADLNFSKSFINRNTFENVNVTGVGDFEETTFQSVDIENLTVKESRLELATFVGREYINRQCCSEFCKPAKCLCNVTNPSGDCPVGDSSVNVSALREVCFPADATLRNDGGKVITMEELALREKVAIGRGEHSDVYFFGHRSENDVAEFVTIVHDRSARRLRLSPMHYLYVNGALQTAQTVQVGDRLRGDNGSDDVKVTSVKMEKARGLYAPTSLHGDLLVDDVIVSSYTSAIHPGLAHKLLHPLRLMYRYGLGELVSRVSIFEHRSWEPVARTLGLPRGPDTVIER